jgi:hypothetical protein
MFSTRKPVLFIWTSLDTDNRESRSLSPWLKTLIAKSYELHRGYAILADSRTSAAGARGANRRWQGTAEGALGK